MIIFRNKGVIDPRAIRTFGFSVKKENSIGFFGTGLKYAIAILLREGADLSFISGGQDYKFSLSKVESGGKEFDIVCMNGEELGFTTELGKTWSMWQAFRELYCNCTDEGGEISAGSSIPKCGKDETLVLVRHDDFEDIFRNIDAFILQGDADWDTPYVEIRRRSGHSAFYKGIRVKDDMGHCLYTYNIKNKIDLTEDRTAKYNFQVSTAIMQGIVSLKDKSLIERIIRAPDQCYEGKLDYDITIAPSPEFLDVCSRLAEDQCVDANRLAIKYAQRHVEMNTEPKTMELSPLQESMLARAKELLMLAGYQINKYPIKCVKSLGTGVYAEAREGAIYIAEPCFMKGTKTVAHALIEEHWHIEHGFKDETRQFQTFLFDQVLTLVERLNQEAF